MIDTIPNIPRVYTGLSEWLACITLLYAASSFTINFKNLLVALFLGIGQVILQLFVGTWPLFFWIAGMVINVAWMLFTIHILSNMTRKQKFYLTFKAFVFAEFIASFTWQLYCYLFLNRFDELLWIQISFILIGYFLLCTLYFIIEKHSQHYLTLKNLSNRGILIAFLTAIIIFTVSNMGFMLSNTTFALGDSVTIFIFRSLINLCGILLIYIQEKGRYENNLRKELSAMNNVFQSQYEQYEAYRESTQIINRKFHDLKHQLEIIQLEPSGEKRQQYVQQIKEDLQAYGSNIKTGNPIIDVVLTRKNIYCIENGIAFTCIVDGALLNFMDTMDLVSLLGNGLDNAIESAIQIEDQEKRLINLRVSRKSNFILYSLENYTENTLIFEDGLPKTTKDQTELHGYGLKSTAFIAEKYNGSMTIHHENNWFKLAILIPVE